MELKHTINGIEILEPIGFDGLKTTIKRHDYHGMSAEVSVGTLEFSGEAASIIHDAYNTDIDTELNYVVTDEYGTVIYTGMIDLSTYDEHSGDYFTVSCKVGEVGVKTTFNNRTETEIDLNTYATLEDKPLAHVPTWKKLTIPAKTIRYKNIMEQPSTEIYNSNVGGDPLTLPDDSQRMFIALTLKNKKINEFGTFEPVIYAAKIPDLVLDGLVEPLFNKGDGFADKFGGTSKYTLDVNITIRIKFNGNIIANATDQPYMQVNFGMYQPDIRDGIMSGTHRFISNDGGSYDYGGGSYADRDTEDCHDTLTYTLKGKLDNCSYDRIFLGLCIYNFNDGWNNPEGFTIEIEEGSYVRMTLDSKNTSSVSANMLMIHEALNVITEAISNNELTVKSSLYNRCDSIVNALPTVSIQAGVTQFGDGSLKAITNGYKIRGLYTDMEHSRNMPLSFKDAIQALDAIDCIGWGFSQENGQLYIRVEKWDWFYRYIHLFSINGAKEKSRKMDTNLAITELNIGYKKYMTAEDVSSIDSVHGERTFTSTTKAISKKKSVLCPFIADNYAIEETRRARLTKLNEDEFKYDENIFIFALTASQYYNGGISYYIPKDIDPNENCYGVNQSEVYNAKISPTRNAFRWINRLFCLKGLKPFELTKGTVNYQAEFKTRKDEYRTGYARDYYLNDDMNNIPMLGIKIFGGEFEDSYGEAQWPENLLLQERYYTEHVCDETDGEAKCEDVPSENDYIIPRVFKAEELIIKYPITFSQYKAIMANPYGIITVDGEECWLKEMIYSFFKDEAELKLIPKAN